MYLHYLLMTLVIVGPVLARHAHTTERTTPAVQDVQADCKNKPADIYFLLDSSSSLMPMDFKKMLKFVENFVKNLDVRANATRVGLGTFSDIFQNEFLLDQYVDKESLVEAINGVQYYGGSTYTGRGLRGMRTIGFQTSNRRPNATKIGIVLTDGRSRQRTNTLAEATEAQRAGIKLLALGVGSGLDEDELATFASEPRKDFVKHVQSFDLLLGEVTELVGRVCRLQRPRPDNATCGKNKKADIVFVYNAASMSADNVAIVRNFMGQVVSNFSMTSGNVRVGVISEGRQGEDISLSEHVQKEDFVNALNTRPRPSLAPLLRKVRLQSYAPDHGGRRDSRKIVIIFYDEASPSMRVMLEAWRMSYRDILIFVIKVGSSNPNNSIIAMHLTSLSKHVMDVHGYDQLKDQSQKSELLEKLCAYL